MSTQPLKRAYSPEFKEQAIALVESSDKPLQQIADELEMSRHTLSNWMKAHRRGELARPGIKTTLDEKDLEIRRLKVRIAQLEEERTILRKAAAYFVKHPA